MEEPKLNGPQLLSKFLCPLACDLSTLPNSNSCPFGHHEAHPKSSQNEQQLKTLPSYCCASFLVLKCSKKEYSFKSGVNSSTLTRCSDGFHVDLSELDDLEMFKEKMIRMLLEASDLDQSDSKFVGLVPGDRIPIEMQNQISSSNSGHKRPHVDHDEEDDESSCAICLNRLSNNQTPFGLLESCSHVFCATCIHKWQNEGTKENCPMCRKPIAKILVWPNLVKTQEKKIKLFELINGIPTYFTTSGGETIRAQQMNPENMKVFLKKPKPNWNCYLIKSKDDADDSVPLPNNVATNNNRIDANTVEAIFNIINNPPTRRNVSSDNPSTPPSLRRQRRLQRELDHLRQIRVLGNPPTISDSD